MKVLSEYLNNHEVVLACDVGGTTLSHCAINANGELLIPLHGPANSHDIAEKALHTLTDPFFHIIHALKGKYHIRGVGLGVPGPFDYQNGISFLTKKFEALYQFDLKSYLKNKLQLPVFFRNDADCFTIGEAAFLDDTYRKIMGITLGTGLGVCFIEDDCVIEEIEGVTPLRGEIWCQQFKGRDLEETLSIRGILEIAKKYLNTDNIPDNIKDLAERAYQGDNKCISLFKEFGILLSEGLDLSIQKFQPDILLLGGQISRSLSLFSHPLETKVNILQSKLFDNAAMLGAGIMALSRLEFGDNSGY